MDMKERFNRAFAYLRGEQIIKGQKDLAEKLGATPGNISKALSGDKSALTNNLMKRFCAAFPGMFNLRWLILGEGNMLQSAEMAQEAPQNVEVDNSTINEIERLKNENEVLIKTINVMAAELSAIRADIAELRKSICVTIPVRYNAQESDPSHLNETREMTVK